MLTLDLNFPKTQIVRAVVFDFDDLIGNNDVLNFTKY